MATTNFEIRLSLRDSEIVKRALHGLGEDGERALKRLELAAQPASRGLIALNTAGEGLQTRFRGLVSDAGFAGDIISKLGPAGIAAAAGIGAISIALTAGLASARHSIEIYGQLRDQADQIGTSVE